MERPGSEAPRARLSSRRRLVLLATVCALEIASAVVFIVRDTGPSNPVEAVEGFMHALSAGDLESAETYLVQPLPTGEDAVFLHFGALSNDWKLTDAHETGPAGDLRTVAVTIRGGDGRTFSGELQVASSDGFLIFDPYTSIGFTSHYETVVSANGHTAVLAPDTEVRLLPGMYEFAYDAYELAPAAVLGQASMHEPVPPAEALEGADLDSALQEAIDSRLGECRAFLAAQPRGCSFGMPARLVHAEYDEDADTGEGILIDLVEPEWNIVRDPVVEAWSNPDLDEAGWFGLRFADPGLLELTVTGTDVQTAEQMRVTVECPMSDDDLAAALHIDGSIELGEVQQMLVNYVGSLQCGEWQ